MNLIQQHAPGDASGKYTIATAVFAGAFNQMADFEIEFFCIFCVHYKITSRFY